jgi:Raf kinase inhibitor-like YbhB/YbcL family protein
MSLKVTSRAFEPDGAIPLKYTPEGENLTPPLAWEALPPGTRQLALILEDPDAPRAEPFVHWVLYKIPADAAGLPEGLPPKKKVLNDPPGAVQGENSTHDLGYVGPFPPPGHGTHHYHFRVYALDKPLEVEAGLDQKALIAAMSGHIIDTGELVGTYERRRSGE